MTTPLLDADAMYKYLWERSDSHNNIFVNNNVLGAALGVSHDTVLKCLTQLTKQGRVKSQKTRERYGIRYHITPPSSADLDKVRSRRVPAWG